MFTQNKDRVYRIFATLLSILFFYFFPTIAATSYMTWHGFYSYDLFNTGATGISAFYWWAEIITLVSAIYFTGVFYFIGKYSHSKEKINQQDKILFFLILAINIFLGIFLFILTKNRSDEFSIINLIGTYIISIWSMIHVSIIIHSRGKHAFYSILTGIFILSTTAIISPGSLAMPYSLSLQYFGNGGRVPISLKVSDHPVEGELILASPENYYIQIKNKLTIIKRDDSSEVYINNLFGFGHKDTSQ
jgi:hypothetical protein